MGEIYRVNFELLRYPRIPGYPLTHSLLNINIIYFSGFCLKCYECPKITFQGRYANVCFDTAIGIDIKSPPEKECANDEICFYDKTVNSQADGSLKTDNILRHCISKGAKPADYEVGKCKTRKLSGTAT